jgi:hypothetical protein
MIPSYGRAENMSAIEAMAIASPANPIARNHHGRAPDAGPLACCATESFPPNLDGSP